MKKSIIYITFLILNLFGLNLIAQTDTEFWFIKSNITSEHTNETFKIVFTTREFPADVTIEMPAEPLFTPVTFSIAAYTTYTYTVTQPSALFSLMENSTVVDELSVPIANRDNIGNKAILVTSTAPINAYLTQTATNNSDIYALKGGNGIGTEFIIPFQTHGFNMDPAYTERAFSSIDIISFEDGTVVQIIPPAGKSVFRSGTFQNQTLPYTVTLNRGQVYTCPPGWDPAVTRNNTANSGWWAIDGNKHIGGVIVKVLTGSGVAVTKKDDSVRKYTTGGWDEIADQWVPYKGVVGEDNDILGTEYVAMRGNLDNGWEFVYVAAPENNTRIWWGNVDTNDVANLVPDAVIHRGQQVGIQFDKLVFTNNFMEIISNKPLSVLHVSGVGQEMGGAVLPPISKCTGSTSVSFSRDIRWPLYINIMVRAGAQDDFLFDGVVRNDIIDPATFVSVGSTGDWVAAQIYYALDDFSDFAVGAVHTISNTKDVFHVGLINGNSTGGCRFGYFSDFNELKVSANTIQGDGTQPSSTIRACKGDTVQLYASGGSVFHWWPSDNLSNTTISNPKAVVDAFRTYFVEVSGACNNRDTATVTIEMADQPDAVFFMETSQGCAPLDLEFRNLSTDVNQIYWDFNTTLIGGVEDRDTTKYHPSIITDVDSSFTHTFYNTSYEPAVDTPQIYNIQLKVKSTKCIDTYNTSVTIYPEVIADFTLSDLDDTLSCNPAVVDFQSSVLSVNEDYYKWSFGDGALSAIANPTHEYNNIQLNSDTTYNAQLVVRSQWFCRDTARMDFTVHPYLEGGFTIDKDKGCSPLIVKFTNLSAGEDVIDLNYGDATAHYNTLPFSTVNHTYKNTGPTVQKYPITLTTSNDEGCIEIWRDTVTVYPEVKANYTIDAGGYTGCNTRNATFTRLTPLGADITNSILWTFGDGETSTSTAAIAPFTVPHTYTNSTNADKNYSFNMRVQSQYGCTHDTTYNYIQIYRADADFVVNPSQGCSVLPVSITNTSIGDNIPAVGGWSWNYGDLSPLVTTKQPGIHTHNYTNIKNPGVNQLFNLSLTVTRNASCTDTKNATITVNPSVSVSFTTIPVAPVRICDSVQVAFNSSLAVPVAGTLYAWDFGDLTSSSIADPSHIYRNLSSASEVTYPAKVTATTTSGCTSNATAPIIVRPYVNALYTLDSIAGCTPLTVDTRATSYIGIPTSKYVWSYGDGFNLTGIINPAPHTYPTNPAPGPNKDYPLRLTVSDLSGLCTDFMEKTITVYAAAKANFTPQEVPGCNPFTVDFNGSASSSNSTIFHWDFADGTTSNIKNPLPKDFYNLTDAVLPLPYNIQLTATTADGCTHDTSANIYVYRYVNADFAVNITEGCSPVIVTVTNNSRGGTYRWYWDDATGTGPIDSTTTTSTGFFTHKYTNTTGVDKTFYLTVKAENANGCSELFTRQILVHSSITADFSYVQTSACNPSDVVFKNESIGSGTYTMNWDFGDGSTLTTTTSPVPKQFINNLTNDKIYHVVMTAESENGCPDSYTDDITVYSKLIADFSIEDNEGCPPFTTSIENTSIGNTANTYQWLIDNVGVGGSPTNKDDFTHTYNNLITSIRNYDIKLIATNSHDCKSEYSDGITVYEYVEASYEMDIDEGCNPLDIQFNDLSSVPPSTKYTWEFNDGATSGSESPSHKFYNSSRETDKPYSIKLTVQSPNYCFDDITQNIMVYHQPLAKFLIDKTSSCPPLRSYLDKTESLGETKFEWRFGDGTLNNTTDEIISPYHEYLSTGSGSVDYYPLELWVGTVKGCQDSTSLTVSVFPEVTADFTYDAASYCSPVVLGITNNSSPTAQNYIWNFGDGNESNLREPVNRYDNTWDIDRTYTVYLKASSEYNCWDTITKPVKVYVQPIADFNLLYPLVQFPESTAFIDNLTSPSTGPWDYLWEFGDLNNTTSGVAEPNTFVYEDWGDKNIKLTVTNQNNSLCYDDVMKTLKILPPIVNTAIDVDVDRGCEPLNVQFTAGTSIHANDEYDFEWDFGDNTTGTGSTPNHLYESSGLYNVKLIARGEGGEDYEYRTIRVFKNPEASFNIAPKLTMFNQDLEARIEYFNLSECEDTLGCNYLWNFGDGSTSIEREGVYNYTELGTYDVSLVVTTSQGCKDSLMHENEVIVVGEGQIKFPNAFTPNIDGPLGCRTDQGYDKYSNDIFFPVYAGVIKYELLIHNRWGELIFKSNDVDCGWDGYVDGKLAKQDVYVWKATGKFTNGRAFETAGDVTLIR